MLPPEELMIELFIPAIRQLVSKKLAQEGYSQSSISRLLGVTQAAVSQYLSAPDSKAYDSLKLLCVESDEADRYASLLSEDAKRNSVYSVETLRSIWTGLLGSGKACDEHRRRYPSLAECDVCIREYRVQDNSRASAIDHVTRAVAILERSRAFASLIPQVSVNLAYAPEGASSLDEVVAVPGRIVRVKGAAKATLRPEFGASRHMAGMLLLAMKASGHKAVINVRYDRRVRSIVKKMGLKLVELPPEQTDLSPDPVLQTFSSVVKREARFDAVADPGGRGREPNLYIFENDAVALAKLAVRIAEAYSA